MNEKRTRNRSQYVKDNWIKIASISEIIYKASEEARPTGIGITTVESSCTAVPPPIAVNRNAMESERPYGEKTCTTLSQMSHSLNWEVCKINWKTCRGEVYTPIHPYVRKLPRTTPIETWQTRTVRMFWNRVFLPFPLSSVPFVPYSVFFFLFYFPSLFLKRDMILWRDSCTSMYGKCKWSKGCADNMEYQRRNRIRYSRPHANPMQLMVGLKNQRTSGRFVFA